MGYNVLAKPQPCDVACERATLGAALTYNACLDELTDALFYDGESRAILAVAKAIREEGKEADTVSVMAYSNEHQCGINPVTLTELFDNADPVSAFSQNVERLRLLAARRRSLSVAYLLESMATNESLDVFDSLTKAQEQLNEIASTAQPKTDDYVIDLSVPYQKPQYILELNGAGCIPQSDIQGVVAGQKQGKTHLFVLFAASMLGCSDLGFKSLVPDANILYVDTEQAEADAANVAIKIHTLMGWPIDRNNDRLRLICLRSKAVKERLPIIVREAKKIQAYGLIH